MNPSSLLQDSRSSTVSIVEVNLKGYSRNLDTTYEMSGGKNYDLVPDPLSSTSYYYIGKRKLACLEHHVETSNFYSISSLVKHLSSSQTFREEFHHQLKRCGLRVTLARVWLF